MNSQRPNPVLRPQFIQGSAGRLFLTHYSPAKPPSERHALLIIPPFADEMNKSRHMFSILARSLVSQGMDCCIVDLYGTGDSEGDFADADWDIWCNDVHTVYSWLRQQDIPTVSLLGMRTGALLAADLIHRQLVTANNLIFWQSVTDGEVFLNQSLRLRIAAQMLDKMPEQSTTDSLRKSLQRDEPVEVAGYMLSPALAQRLAARKLVEADVSSVKQVCWFEISSRQDAPLSRSSQNVVDQWQSQGVKLRSSVLRGPGFWTTSEIAEVPTLVEATVECLQGAKA